MAFPAMLVTLVSNGMFNTAIEVPFTRQSVMFCSVLLYVLVVLMGNAVSVSFVSEVFCVVPVFVVLLRIACAIVMLFPVMVTLLLSAVVPSCVASFGVMLTLHVSVARSSSLAMFSECFVVFPSRYSWYSCCAERVR